MSISPLPEQDWQTLLSLLPAEREASARAFGALLRKREIQDADTLLRLIFVYSWADHSLRNTSAWAVQKGIAKLLGALLMETLVSSWASFSPSEPESQASSFPMEGVDHALADAAIGAWRCLALTTLDRPQRAELPLLCRHTQKAA